MNTPTLQPLQDCNANPCRIAMLTNCRIAMLTNCRNAKVLCQNAMDPCWNVDPAYSLEGLNKRVSNGTSAHPLFDRRTSYVF